MKTKTLELKSDRISYHQSASEMDNTTLSTWFAFCNALKFINHGEDKYHEEVRERDIPYSAILNYTQTVSGDIRQFLEHKNAIPLKYSLDVSMEESKKIDEIDMIVDL